MKYLFASVLTVFIAVVTASAQVPPKEEVHIVEVERGTSPLGGDTAYYQYGKLLFTWNTKETLTPEFAAALVKDVCCRAGRCPLQTPKVKVVEKKKFD